MHYYRLRRTGSTDRLPPKGFSLDPRGYVLLYLPEHPLRDARGMVYEHRVVLFGKIGPGPVRCSWCTEWLSWDGTGRCLILAVHLDGDLGHNAPSNITPCCSSCLNRREPPGEVEPESAAGRS